MLTLTERLLRCSYANKKGLSSTISGWGQKKYESGQMTPQTSFERSPIQEVM